MGAKRINEKYMGGYEKGSLIMICHPERSGRARLRAVLRSRGTPCVFGGSTCLIRSSLRIESRGENSSGDSDDNGRARGLSTSHEDRKRSSRYAQDDALSNIPREGTHHPTFIPLFCSSSHFFSGAK
jgi:hypothetical protein